MSRVALRYPKPVRRRSKYGNVRVGGYASKAEAQRGADLKLMHAAGLIQNVREQIVYEIQPPGCERICLRIDYQYEQNGVKILEDVKGMATREAIIKLKLLKASRPECVVRTVDQHGRVLREFKARHMPPITEKEKQPCTE